MSYRIKNGVVEVNKGGIWRVVPKADVTAEMRAAAERVESRGGNSVPGAGRYSEDIHLEALEIDFALSHFVTVSNGQRMFDHEGTLYTQAEFTIVMGIRFGWKGLAASWHKRLNDVMVENSGRIKAFAHRYYAGKGTGVGNAPAAIEGLVF